MPTQFPVTFTPVKPDNIQIKKCDIFLISAQKHRLWVHVRTTSLRQFLGVKTINVLSKNMKNQRTNGPVNAHLISRPSKAQKHTKPGKYMVKK